MNQWIFGIIVNDHIRSIILPWWNITKKYSCWTRPWSFNVMGQFGSLFWVGCPTLSSFFLWKIHMNRHWNHIWMLFNNWDSRRVGNNKPQSGIGAWYINSMVIIQKFTHYDFENYYMFILLKTLCIHDTVSLDGGPTSLFELIGACS